MSMIGFDIADVKSEKDMDNTIDQLENEILTVGEVFRGKQKKVRKVESVVRMCLKKCHLHKWKAAGQKLTKMLAVVEDIKYEVNDVVNGYNW